MAKKLDDFLSDFYDASKTASTINRQIAFAGIAVVWVFVKSNEGKLFIDDPLRIAILCFVCALFFDIIQYIYQTLVLHSFHRRHEKKKKNKSEELIKWPTHYNYPTWTFFALKILSTLIGYCILFGFILKNVQ